MKMNFIKGDATMPIAKGNKIIVHICNDIGGWGKGFVMAISARWKEPEQQYRKWFASSENFQLGEVQLVQVEEEIWVANIIGQHGIKKDKEGKPPVRYDAIQKALTTITQQAMVLQASIHMPRIGCGLAGGEWEIIQKIIEKEIIQKNITVTVYDF